MGHYELPTIFFGGKYDLIQLHRQIIRQNDGIEIFTTSISFSKFKVNNKNDMAACAFWACFCST